MIHIDFLPEKYRQHNANRRKRVWRFAVIGLFGAAFAASAVFQFLSGRHVDRQLKTVQSKYAEATVLNERLVQLQKRLNGSREQARLVTFLMHRWPTTQFLARIVERVPESITFSRIEFKSVENASLAAKSSRRRRRRSTPVAGPPARADLATLSETANQQQFVIRLVGKTAQAPDLHDYVAALSSDRLFTSAELSSLVESDFTIRLTIQAGYGLHDGPTLPATAARSPSSASFRSER